MGPNVLTSKNTQNVVLVEEKQDEELYIYNKISFKKTTRVHVYKHVRVYINNGEKISIKLGVKGFPGGAVVKNPPANAGDTGSNPGQGRSHMLWSNKARAPQLLSPRATTTEPTYHNY